MAMKNYHIRKDDDVNWRMSCCMRCEYHILKRFFPFSKQGYIDMMKEIIHYRECLYFHHRYITVYLSDYIKTESGYDLSLDFYLPSDLLIFFRAFGLELPNIQDRSENIRLGTFFRILNFQSGTEEINFKRRSLYYLDVLQLKENSELIDYDSSWRNNSQYFAQLKMSRKKTSDLFYKCGDFYYPSEIFTEFCDKKLSIAAPSSDDIKLIVNNVGQGNWNQINVEKKPYIMYDLGMTCTTNKASSQNILLSHKNSFITGIPLLVISHWHDDHYNILLEMNDSQKDKFNNVLFSLPIANLSACNIISYFVQNTHTKVVVTPNPLTKKLKYIPINRNLCLYTHKRTRNLNNAGNILVVKGDHSNAILTGDSNYSNLKTIILSSKLKITNTYLVVPHHGGNAGRSTYPAGGSKGPEAIISVGKGNPYKHPFNSVLNQLNKTFQKVSRTDLIKDDIIRKL